MLKGIYLVNRVSNMCMGGLLFAWPVCPSLVLTVIVKRVSSIYSLNCVTLLNKLFKAYLCIMLYREVSL